MSIPATGAWVVTLALLCWLACGASAPQEAPAPGDTRTRNVEPTLEVLVFSKTAGFRHASIPDGIKAIRELGRAGEKGVDGTTFKVTATEDSAIFNRDSLPGFDAVVFLSTTGDILDKKQQEAFEAYIRDGGGYVGVHAAADTEYSWPWYGKLVGAYFKGHPRIQPADVVVEDRTHRSTRMLPGIWNRTDEWYVYRENPRARVRVLASLDESTYEGGGMNGDHPIAWYHEFDGGRSWYTGGGHTSESFREPLFRAHILGGILWAADAKDVPPGRIREPAKKDDDESPGDDVNEDTQSTSSSSG